MLKSEFKTVGESVQGRDRCVIRDLLQDGGEQSVTGMLSVGGDGSGRGGQVA